MAALDTIKKYVQLIKNLLPFGFAWDSIKEDSLNLFQGIATEFCRVDDRAKDLLVEFDPGTATELLTDWETLLGLPDECSPPETDLIERRVLARQKLAAQGGLSANYLESIADNLGFDAEITDYLQFRVGRQRVGDPLTNDFDIKFRVGSSRVGEQLRITGWLYVFNVNVLATDVGQFRVGTNRVGDSLRTFENPILECTMFRSKPAHTQPFFTFRES